MIRTAASSSAARRSVVYASSRVSGPSISARRYSSALSTHPSASSSSSRDDGPPPLRPKTASQSASSSRLQPRSVPQRSTVQATPTRTNASSSSASTSAETATQASSTSSSSSSKASPSAQSSPSSSSSSSPDPPPPKRTLLTRIKDLYAQLKFLFRFYLNGVKQIWRDRQRVADIRKQCAEQSRQMTWGEARLAKVHREDIKKLPLFLAILLIVEEVLPLVVIYAPFLLPSTCILPSQLLKIRQGEETKRAAAIERLRTSSAVRDLMAAASLPGPNKGPSPSRSSASSSSSSSGSDLAHLPTLSAEAQSDLAALWKALGKDTLVDLSAVFALPTTLRPTAALRRNLEKRAQFLLADDGLLEAGRSASSSSSSKPSSTADAPSMSTTQTAGRSGSPTQENHISGVATTASGKAVKDAPAPTASPAPLANWPADVPALSSILSERGLRASEAEQGEMEEMLRVWTRASKRVVERRVGVESAKMEGTAAEAATPATAAPLVDLLFLPLSLYPPPELFTPSLSAPGSTSAAAPSAAGEQATTTEQSSGGGLLEKSKEVVREVVEAEERRERLMKEKEEQEKKEAAAAAGTGEEKERRSWQ